MLPLEQTVRDLQMQIERLKLENYQLRSQLGMPVPRLPVVQKTDEVASNWKCMLQGLHIEQARRKCHLIEEPNSRNKEIMDKFMAIFDMTPDKNKPELIQQTLLPVWKDDGERRKDTAFPLHLVAFLSDSVALGKLRPFLREEDVDISGPFDCTLLHMIISGIEKKAYVGSPVECALTLLCMRPGMRYIENCYGSKAIDYANYALRGREWEELKSVLM